MEAERPIRERRLLLTHALDRQPANQDEPATPLEGSPPSPDGGCEHLQRHVVPCELLARDASSLEIAGDPHELRDLCSSQRLDPCVAPGKLRSPPCGRSFDRAQDRLGHGAFLHR
jgi:hypothetical protein